MEAVQDDFVERQEPVEVEQVMEPTPGSLRAPAEIEADLIEVARRLDAAEADCEVMESKRGADYQALLAGRDDEQADAQIESLHALIRRLKISKNAVQVDLAAARKREQDGEIASWHAALVVNLNQCNANARKIEANLQEFCQLMHQQHSLQTQSVSAMNEGKRLIPPAERRGSVMAAASVQSLADPTMLSRWVAIATRAELGAFYPGSGNTELCENFDRLVRNATDQALAEWELLMGYHPSRD